MWIEYIAYIATFIISTGTAVIGITISYNLYQSDKKPELAVLLYQQVFLFSFFIYGIWGNLGLREVIADLNLSEQISQKLAVFIPVIGIPFLIVSWFMLLKFAYNLNGYKFEKYIVYSYFPTLVVLVFILAFLIQKEILAIPENPDLFIVRIIVMLNLLIHVITLAPFFRPKRSTPILKETGFTKNRALLNFLGVLGYSGILIFFDVFGFISTCISIIILFAVSVFIPVKIRINMISTGNGKPTINMDFLAFCSSYDISKRESEIIQEICSGKTNKAISEKLFITLQTVKDHTHRIYTKTGVNSRVQLANLVREKTGG